MDNASLEELIRKRYDLNMFEGLVIMEVSRSEDDISRHYLVTCLLYTEYKQEKMERKVFKLRY